MSLLFIQQWVSESVLRAICWTLIHSIWQGIAIAILAGLVILFTRKSVASLRYNLLSGCLLLFVLVSIFTFSYEMKISDQSSAKDAFQPTSNSLTISALEKDPPSIGTLSRTENFFGSFNSYLNEHASFIVLIWFLFFLAKSIQLSSGFYYIHRLRHERNYDAPSEWIDRLQQLAKTVGVNQKILFLESGLVQMPVVIGILKPAILIPFGLITQLSVSQVEAILLHELAHIKRKDFLVNLIQSFTDAIYFFNPATLWISSLIREEREACCDDIVVRIMPYKKSYLEALVSFQDEANISAGHAMALGGKKNYLLRRVQRMLTHENKKLNIMEKSILFLGLIGITAFSFIPVTSEKAREITNDLNKEQAIKFSDPVKPVEAVHAISPLKQTVGRKAIPSINAKISLPVVDTVPKSKTKEPISFPSISSSVNDDGVKKTVDIEATDNTGKKYKIKKIDNEITEMRVNGELIPKENYDDHSLALRSMNESMARGSISRAKFNNEKFNEERNQKLLEKSKKYDIENKKMHKEFEEKRKEKFKEINRNNEIRNRKMIQRNNELVQKSRVEDSARVFRNGNRAIKVNNNSNRSTTGEVSLIIMELQRAGAIHDKENISFNFNDKELIVNGAKQPSELHDRLKQKYLQKAGDYIIYKKNGNTTSTTINHE